METLSILSLSFFQDFWSKNFIYNYIFLALNDIARTRYIYIYISKVVLIYKELDFKMSSDG